MSFTTGPTESADQLARDLVEIIGREVVSPLASCAAAPRNGDQLLAWRMSHAAFSCGRSAFEEIQQRCREHVLNERMAAEAAPAPVPVSAPLIEPAPAPQPTAADLPPDLAAAVMLVRAMQQAATLNELKWLQEFELAEGHPLGDTIAGRHLDLVHVEDPGTYFACPVCGWHGYQTQLLTMRGFGVVCPSCRSTVHDAAPAEPADDEIERARAEHPASEG